MFSACWAVRPELGAFISALYWAWLTTTPLVQFVVRETTAKARPGSRSLRSARQSQHAVPARAVVGLNEIFGKIVELVLRSAASSGESRAMSAEPDPVSASLLFVVLSVMGAHRRDKA